MVAILGRIDECDGQLNALPAYPSPGGGRRGLLSLDNIETLTKLQVPGKRVDRRPLEFTLAVPGKRHTASSSIFCQPWAMEANLA